MKTFKNILTLAFTASIALPVFTVLAETNTEPGTNPIIKDKFTADPAPMVSGDTLYLYVGHDEAGDKDMFRMNEWLCYSSKDMQHWIDHGSIMKATDFKWAIKDAWAAQTVEKDGKYYFYATVQHNNQHSGKAIGVAVSDSPTGPFIDAKGSALITDDMTPAPYGWNDIDPTVFIDDDGTAWMSWGNPICYLVKLKSNMIELDGPIETVPLPNYTEGPWLSKHNGLYYLTYASFAHQGFGESICYATAQSIRGPWTYRGILTGQAKNSYTIHPGIADFKGQSYFFYHHADLTLPNGQKGALGRRAVCAEYLYYNPDGSIQPIEQTKDGISIPAKKVSFKHSESNHGSTDSSITVSPICDFYPTEWPGTPNTFSVSNPYYEAPVSFGFNMNGGIQTIGQTFLQNQDITLESITLYAGDGTGTDTNTPLKLSLYDLGENSETTSKSYIASENLLGNNSGVEIAYNAQAAGIFKIQLNKTARIHLKAGHRYALELETKKANTPIYWRKSRQDVFSKGSAYADRQLILDKEGKTSDFAFAIYGLPH
jgi:hypothetical protein